MKNEIIYIIGKTGIYDHEANAIMDEAEYLLRKRGYKVINPLRLTDEDKEWPDCIRTDIAAIFCSNAVYVLPNWKTSDLAIMQFNIALNLKLKIIFASKMNFLNIQL
jgi:hypothetical protein